MRLFDKKERVGFSKRGRAKLEGAKLYIIRRIL
jgi:hypothetical protein